MMWFGYRFIVPGILVAGVAVFIPSLLIYLLRRSSEWHTIRAAKGNALLVELIEPPVNVDG